MFLSACVSGRDTGRETACAFMRPATTTTINPHASLSPSPRSTGLAGGQPRGKPQSHGLHYLQVQCPCVHISRVHDNSANTNTDLRASSLGLGTRTPRTLIPGTATSPDRQAPRRHRPTQRPRNQRRQQARRRRRRPSSPSLRPSWRLLRSMLSSGPVTPLPRARLCGVLWMLSRRLGQERRFCLSVCLSVRLSVRLLVCDMNTWVGERERVCVCV